MKFEFNQKMIEETRKGLIGPAMQALGFSRLDYSMRQLRALEDKIESMYPIGHQPMIPTLFTLGFFLGECIIHNVEGSKWNTSNHIEDPMKIEININMGDGSAVSYPAIRVRKFWFDRSERMSTFLRMLQQMNEINFDPEYLKKRVEEDGFIQTNYGDRMRIRTVTKEELKNKGL